MFKRTANNIYNITKRTRNKNLQSKKFKVLKVLNNFLINFKSKIDGVLCEKNNLIIIIECASADLEML